MNGDFVVVVGVVVMVVVVVVVVCGGGVGVHLLGLSQSHSAGQVTKQFWSGSESEYNWLEWSVLTFKNSISIY